MLSTGDGIKQLMTGVDLHAPDAKLSNEAPIEFNAADAMGQDVFDHEKKPTFAQLDGADHSWAPVRPSDDWKEDKKVITKEWASQARMAGSILDAWIKVDSFKLWDLKHFHARVPKETINKFDETYMTMPALTVAY